MIGADVVREARAWKGVPFRHQGRSKSGCDCAGLIIGVARELGLDRACGYVDEANYPRQPSNDKMMRLLRHYLTLIRTGVPQTGDVLHFCFQALPQHVAIYTGPQDNRIIHSYNSSQPSAQRVIETYYAGKWPKRLHAIYRFQGLEKAA